MLISLHTLSIVELSCIKLSFDCSVKRTSFFHLTHDFSPITRVSVKVNSSLDVCIHVWCEMRPAGMFLLEGYR